MFTDVLKHIAYSFFCLIFIPKQNKPLTFTYGNADFI